jgi:cellobiose phosphorylase
VLGVRPEWDGLHLDPCLPPDWPGASMTRPYRDCTYRIQVERSAELPAGAPAEVSLDGAKLSTSVIAPPTEPGQQHEVYVRCR